MKYINLLIIIILTLSLTGCLENEIDDKFANVNNGNIETIQYDNVKLSGKYENGLVNIKLENVGTHDVLITKVNVITFDTNNKKTNHEFKTSQLLKVNQTAEMSFVQELEDVTKIKYKIVKEKVS